MTRQEARSLALAGQIEKIGPKLWRVSAQAWATARATETGNGLLSRDIEGWLRELMASEDGPFPEQANQAGESRLTGNKIWFCYMAH